MIRTMTDLCQRYGISINAMSAFVKAHREEIDPSCDHITKAGKSIYFDDFAVAKIDELRHYTPGIDLADKVLREKEQEKYEKEIQELKNEINTLKTQLLISEHESKEAYKSLAAANAGALESAEMKARQQAQLEIKAAEIERKNIELEEKNLKIRELTEEIKEKNAMLQSRVRVVDRRAGNNWKWRH
jgi:chromosome segregation ATPase